MPEPVIRTTPPRTINPSANPDPVQARRRRRRVRSGWVSKLKEIRPPQVSGGERKVRGRALSTLYLAMPSPATDQWGERLPRHLGLWSAIAVLVGSTIGS